MPVLLNTALELFALCWVVVSCLIISVTLFPWAVYHANFLDFVIHLGLLFISLLAALQTNSVNDLLIGRLLLVVFGATMSVFVAACVWCLYLACLRVRNPSQYFLCHHKEGGGAFCRLLKVRLRPRAGSATFSSTRITSGT